MLKIAWCKCKLSRAPSRSHSRLPNSCKVSLIKGYRTVWSLCRWHTSLRCSCFPTSATTCPRMSKSSSNRYVHSTVKKVAALDGKALKY